jgi:hypothetical protein
VGGAVAAALLTVGCPYMLLHGLAMCALHWGFGGRGGESRGAPVGGGGGVVPRVAVHPAARQGLLCGPWWTAAAASHAQHTAQHAVAQFQQRQGHFEVVVGGRGCGHVTCVVLLLGQQVA